MSTLELAIFCVTIALAAGLSGYVLMQTLKKRKTESLTGAVAAAITSYFLQGSVKVAARCLAQPKDKHFLAFLDSEPHKRFRYSHIVEAVLISHIEKTMDLHIDRVYWRFPLPEQPQTESPSVAPFIAAAAPNAAAQTKTDIQSAAEKSIKAQEDEYITQGLLRAKVRHDYLVDEGSWDLFEKAMQEGEISAQAKATVEGGVSQAESGKVG